MFFKEWVVLLVDDEPDVLSMSKLVMKDFEVYGLPLKIYTAESKAEALELLSNNLEVASSLAVAFIDVVMETDSAGLELCKYIRDDMGNRLSQLFIRTGQPGLSTETDVIDRYDISGYFTKIEATQSKLYSLVKSSVRQYLSFGMSLATIAVLNDLIAASSGGTANVSGPFENELTGTQVKILDAVHHLGGYSLELEDIPRWLFVDGKVLFEEEVDAARGIAMRDQLLAQEGIVLQPGGDQYIKGQEGYQLIQVVEKSSQAEVIYVFQTPFLAPEFVVNLMYSVIAGMATAWPQSS